MICGHGRGRQDCAGRAAGRADQDCEGHHRRLGGRRQAFRMRVDHFDFELPPERIALRPARPRDAVAAAPGRGAQQFATARCSTCRPCCRRATCWCSTTPRSSLPSSKGGAEDGERTIGATLHKREGPREWQAFLRNAKRARVGDAIDFGAGVAASVVDKAADGSALLHFHGDEPVELLLERAGRMPLAALYRARARRRTTTTATIIRRCSRRKKGRWRRRPRRCISPTG